MAFFCCDKKTTVSKKEAIFLLEVKEIKFALVQRTKRVKRMYKALEFFMQ